MLRTKPKVLGCESEGRGGHRTGWWAMCRHTGGMVKSAGGRYSQKEMQRYLFRLRKDGGTVLTGCVQSCGGVF